MNANNSQEERPVSSEDIEAAAADVDRLRPGFTKARSTARAVARSVFLLKTKIASYEFRLRFRRVGDSYQFWPIGVMIIPAFTVGCLLLILGLAFDLSTTVRILTMVFGVSITAYVCLGLLRIPSTNDIQHQLPRLRSDLKLAEIAKENSETLLQSVEKPYLGAKQRYEQLKLNLAEYEERRKRLKREAERRECEQARQEELERVRWVKSVEHRREQLAESNWKAMRGIPFEEFLRDVFEALGHDVEATSVTGDQGVDLIVNDGSRKIAIQVKGYYNSVGNEAVMQAHTGMAHRRCQACAVITNSRFTSSAVELAGSVGCTLIDEDRMHEFIMGIIRI